MSAMIVNMFHIYWVGYYYHNTTHITYTYIYKMQYFIMGRRQIITLRL